MANHKSAKKRSIQSKAKNTVNTQYLTKFRTNLNKFYNSLKGENATEVENSFIYFNGSIVFVPRSANFSIPVFTITDST